MIGHAEQTGLRPDAFGTKKGVINLRSGELIDAKPAQVITKLANVSYDASAKCPTWDSFLLHSMGQNKELPRFVQRAVRYSLTGSISESLGCRFRAGVIAHRG